jgi:saccharopine dehydrogenase-like NADP-dependent oxidoreductase
MKVLLMGVGLQGQAALVDLVRSDDVRHVIAADLEMGRLLQQVPALQHPKVEAIVLDGADVPGMAARMEQADAAIHLMPARFRSALAQTAVENKCHFVDASYADSALRALSAPAAHAGVSILPEFGLDPGIDLVLTARGIAEMDEVHAIRSYGAGIPERRDNPLDYKISWSFQGVLSGYQRPARLLRDGQIVDIPADRLFVPANVHQLAIDGLGTLEAYPNGDAVGYLAAAGLANTVRHAGRYSMRWPGHSEFWRRMVALGFLEEGAVHAGAARVSPRQFVHDLLQPQLQYGAEERDIAIVRVELDGLKDGQPQRLVYQVVDYADLESGLMAMQRTVGFTAAIGARMILRGEIARPGLLSPLTDVPPDSLIAELRARGIYVQRQETALL